MSQTNISGETSDLAGNSFHTFFALNNSTVDVIDTFYNIGHGVNICKNLENDGEEKGKACFWVKPSDYHVAKGSRVVVVALCFQKIAARHSTIINQMEWPNFTAVNTLSQIR